MATTNLWSAISRSRSSNVAGIRWFELRGVTAGPVTTFQDSTYQPDTTWRWMGSVAMDKFGNMALGFSASSATIHPQIRYTGRLATDPINTMTLGEGHIFDGTGSQTATSNRWGDYSDMTVDPVDDQTFWYTQEYYDTTQLFQLAHPHRQLQARTCGTASDTVTITKAQYSIADSQLKVNGDRLQPGRGLDCQGDEFGSGPRDDADPGRR